MAQQLALKTHVSVPIKVLLATKPGVWKVVSQRDDGSEAVLNFSAGKGAPTGVLLKVAGKGKLGSLLMLDCWAVRDYFLNIKRDDDFIAFLNELGAFLPDRYRLPRWSFESLRSWQSLFRKLLRHRPATWHGLTGNLRIPGLGSQNAFSILAQCGDLTVKFIFSGQIGLQQGEPYALVVRTTDIVSAILATIYIDHARGAKFGFCARFDCLRPFEITSNHKRQYCKQECAHCESVRRLRARRKSSRIHGGRRLPTDSPDQKGR